MDERKLEEEIAFLKKQVVGLEWLINGLVLALNRANVIELKNVVDVLTLVRAHVEAVESKTATIPLRGSIAFFDVLLKNPEIDPLHALIAEALLHADVDPAMKEAQRSWLAQASEDEFSLELEQILSRIQRPGAPEEPPPGAPST